MNVTVNGESHELPHTELRVVDLLDHLELETRSGMAIAVNDSVVPRSRWSERSLADGDRVEIVRATQGG